MQNTLKKIKVFSEFFTQAAAQKASKHKSKLIKNDPNFPSNANVEIIHAKSLFKTNKWTSKNPYNLPVPTENDYLIVVTYSVVENVQVASQNVQPKLAKPMFKTILFIKKRSRICIKKTANHPLEG